MTRVVEEICLDLTDIPLKYPDAEPYTDGNSSLKDGTRYTKVAVVT